MTEDSEKDSPPPPAAVATLVDIRLLRLEANLVDAIAETPDGKAKLEDDVNIEIQALKDDETGRLSFIVEYEVVMPAGERVGLYMRSRHGVAFHVSERFDDSADAIHDFGNTTVVMAVHPYVRETLSSLAGRMGIGSTTLGLMRPGQLRAVADFDPEAGDADDTPTSDDTP